MKRFFLPAILILVPAAGFAADPTGEVIAKGKQKKICHEEIRTGTRFTTQICKTKEEWDAEADKAKDAVDDWSRKSGSRYSGGADAGGGVKSGVGIGGM
ncbi:MAG: hypothetical protein J7485_00445 [Sphingobium sp.]|nr:hypothetical protein [Sphingobium sp.]